MLRRASAKRTSSAWLSDTLVSVQQIARLGRTSRAVDQNSAYAAVEAAYREASQGGLLDSPGVSEVQG